MVGDMAWNEQNEREGTMDSRSVHTGKIILNESSSIPQELDRQSDNLMELNKMIGMLEDYLQPLMISKNEADGPGEKRTGEGKSPILTQLEANNDGIRHCIRALHDLTQRVQL